MYENAALPIQNNTGIKLPHSIKNNFYEYMFLFFYRDKYELTLYKVKSIRNSMAKIIKY